MFILLPAGIQAISGPQYFGSGRNAIILDDLNCRGHEERLVNCPHRGIGQHDCTHSKDAGVRCM